MNHFYRVFSAAERHRILSESLLSAHLNSHVSTLKGSINRRAFLYLPSLPTKSFSFVPKRLTEGNSDIQTLPTPVSGDTIFFL